MEATTRVWPSGALRATCSVATLPAAPVRFSTTTGWPSPAVMPCASTRGGVGAAARGEADHEADRPVGAPGGAGGRLLRTGCGRGEQGRGGEQRKDIAAPHGL